MPSMSLARSVNGMANDIQPAQPRGHQARSQFTLAYAAYFMAAIVGILAVVLTTAGLVPALILLVPAGLLGYYGRSRLKQAEPQIR